MPDCQLAIRRLARLSPLGLKSMELQLAIRVACAGAGVANHAELIDVPVNLSVPVPDQLSFDAAATVTLGAIAMQGVRRALPTLGETIVVVGLGILGQITAQLLSANGCRVIGTDVDPGRIATALENGLDIGINPGDGNLVERVVKLTDGYGADAIVITAASASSDILAGGVSGVPEEGAGRHRRRCRAEYGARATSTPRSSTF